ncbi:MAG: hypothetical protein ACD_29C00411G0003 [uncultured bacterium]|nr:MAG: hypothetical protein ACD_29C00411G0003 [uncultured bacterium]
MISKNANGHANGAHIEKTTALTFPCHFVVKMMGKTDSAFEQTALNIIQSHFKKFNEAEIKKRYSKDNNYLSLSVTVYVENQAELDALYRDLSSNKEILMVL